MILERSDTVATCGGTCEIDGREGGDEARGEVELHQAEPDLWWWGGSTGLELLHNSKMLIGGFYSMGMMQVMLHLNDEGLHAAMSFLT